MEGTGGSQSRERKERTEKLTVETHGGPRVSWTGVNATRGKQGIGMWTGPVAAGWQVTVHDHRVVEGGGGGQAGNELSSISLSLVSEGRVELEEHAVQMGLLG